MTEEEACRIYASAWNCLVPDDLLNALDDEVRYSSQVVLSDLHGKSQVGQYLRGKMETIAVAPDGQILAELAKTQAYPMYPDANRPCAVVAQGGRDKLVAVVLFTVAKGKIAAIDLCVIPPPQTTKRSGSFPASRTLEALVCLRFLSAPTPCRGGPTTH